jgi:ATP-dependent Clp protease ATP-binding subunit ClpC
MFERYTEGARRVISLAREEAMHYGCPYIEAEHLLLGVLREDPTLPARIGVERISTEMISKEIESKKITHLSIFEQVDLPLSEDSKRVLNHAAEESSGRITSDHLMIGILHLKESLAAKILEAHGVTMLAIRQEIRRNEPPAG